MLQAVDADGDDSTPLGHFVDHPEEAQPLSCRSDAEVKGNNHKNECDVDDGR